jgi:type I restriction enzyme S subunit
MWNKRLITDIADLVQKRPQGDEGICVDLEHVSPSTGKLIDGLPVTGDEVSKLRFSRGDVLFAKLRPYLKKAWLSDREGICSSEFWVFKAKKDMGDAGFLRQFVLSEPFLKACAASSGSKMPRADWSYVETMKFPLPPLAEQRKIAEILRTWDEAIETAEAELKAKLERKRWLMDRLFKFSPESHLEQVKMQDAVDVLKGEQLNRHTLAEKGSYPVWNGGITPSGYTESCNTEGPAVIMSEGGNSCGAITRVNENFWRGGHCYHVVPRNGFSNDYLFAALKYYEPQIMRLRVGSGLPNIQKKAFLSWGAPLHKPAYRDKVASVFTHAQLEGELANKHIGTLRAQKRGLMQKLLTGEVRVAT